MYAAGRFQQLARFLAMTAVFLLVSRVLFDLLAGRPPFWSTHDLIVGFLWTCLVGGPFILFALLVAAQGKTSGKQN